MRREELFETLRKTCDRIALDRKLMLSIVKYCYEKYGVPLNESMDVINDRVTFDTKSDEFIFYLCSGISKFIPELKPADYFNKFELSEFVAKKYTITDDYKIIIPCVPIEYGKQWIGSLNAKIILELDRNNKINYNIEKQRVRQKVVKGNEVFYKTNISMRSVKQIAKLMMDGEYVSDYLTFDIPYDNPNNKFFYDDNKKELVFDNLDSLDITDGYHRLEAMRLCYSKDKNFNYPMGIQITQFSLQKTQQFIYQSDQKNKMTPTQSNSFDGLRPSNEVCNFLNEDGGCIYNRMIKRSGNKTVDFIALSDIVEYYYFGPGVEDKNKKKEYDRGDVTKVATEVKGYLNTYAEENPQSLNRNVNFQELILYFYYIKNKKEKPANAVKKVSKFVDNGKIKEIKLRGVRKPLFDQIEKLGF